MGLLNKIFKYGKDVKNEGGTETLSSVKILFSFYSSILEEWTVETMWAETIDKGKGLYKLDNIPFYVPLVGSDDIVFAEYDASEKMLTYRKTVEYSGNSTIHVVLMDKSRIVNDIRDVFSRLGCTSEKLNEGYFAMEILCDTNYHPVKQKLIELQLSGVIDYAESCLSDKHFDEI